MPFRFGSFKLLSKLEMYKTPLTDCSTVHTVGFRHIETRPVVSIFRFQKSKRSPRHRFRYFASTTDPGPTAWSNQTKSFTVGLLIAPENTTFAPADTRASVLSILPDLIRCIEIWEEEEKRKSRKESRNMRAREKDRTQKKERKDIRKMQWNTCT
ncbi:hypothetical protein V1477_007131 [Vespula maculifrons]|uniref:Uncharacterized protein n=1 Tax=Vespula maculifrons TaxID=7453 RepID=A0ABD2CIA9_VESMC